MLLDVFFVFFSSSLQGPCLFIVFNLQCTSGLFSSAFSEVLFFFCLKSLNPFLEDSSSFVFLMWWWGFEFVHAHASLADIRNHAITSHDYTKDKHVKSWLLSSIHAKFPELLFLTVFWLASHFHIWVHWANFYLFRRCFSLWLIPTSKTRSFQILREWWQ